MSGRRAWTARPWAMVMVVTWLVAALLPTVARACGVCDEDAIASVYDHALVARETGAGHFVVFLRPVGPGGGVAARAARALRGAPGVDAGSVRVSASPAAVAFACAPARMAAVLSAAGDRLRHPGISLHTLRIVSTPMGAQARLR
jgi:hypothetical protein